MLARAALVASCLISGAATAEPIDRVIEPKAIAKEDGTIAAGTRCKVDLDNPLAARR